MTTSRMEVQAVSVCNTSGYRVSIHHAQLNAMRQYFQANHYKDGNRMSMMLMDKPRFEETALLLVSNDNREL